MIEALLDDLNTPLALTRLVALDDPSVVKASAAHAWLARQAAPTSGSGAGGRARSDIDALIARRAEAKARRDFAEADRIRDALAADGVLLEDGPSGTTWRRQ